MLPTPRQVEDFQKFLKSLEYTLWDQPDGYQVECQNRILEKVKQTLRQAGWDYKEVSSNGELVTISIYPMGKAPEVPLPKVPVATP